MSYTETPTEEDIPPEDNPTPAPQAATTMYAPNQQAVHADGLGPAMVHSTGATAGTPGTWTPASSSPPTTLGDLQRGIPFTIAASPGTNWTVGQRVVLGDGTLANWNGTAWVSGAHP